MAKPRIVPRQKPEDPDPSPQALPLPVSLKAPPLTETESAPAPAPSPPANPLFSAATRAGAADADVVREAARLAASSGQSVVDAVIENTGVNENNFLEALAGNLHWPWQPELEPDSESAAELKRACPARLALRHRLLPVSFEPLHPHAAEENGTPAAASEDAVDSANRAIVLACYDPFDLMARQAVARTVPMPVRWRMAPRDEILRGLQTFYGVGADTFDDLMKSRDIDADDAHLRDEANIIDADDAEASVIKFVNQIIR
jgi:general secretion pathway protein E